eukprot:tig00021042_g17596.t1
MAMKNLRREALGRASYLLPPEAPSFADLHVLAHRDAIAGDRPVLGPAAEAAFWEFRWRWAREAPSAALARMVAAVGAAFRSTFGSPADAACPE